MLGFGCSVLFRALVPLVCYTSKFSALHLPSRRGVLSQLLSRRHACRKRSVRRCGIIASQTDLGLVCCEPVKQAVAQACALVLVGSVPLRVVIARKETLSVATVQTVLLFSQKKVYEAFWSGGLVCAANSYCPAEQQLLLPCHRNATACALTSVVMASVCKLLPEHCMRSTDTLCHPFNQ